MWVITSVDADANADSRCGQGLTLIASDCFPDNNLDRLKL